MQKQGNAGVYQLFKLSKGDFNSFSEEFKKLFRDLHVVNHDYAELINQHSSKNGLLYVYNEEASKLYWSKKPYKNIKEYAAFEEVKTIEDGDEVGNLPTEINIIPKLREEYEELSGKKPNSLWKEPRLQDEINKLK